MEHFLMKCSYQNDGFTFQMDNRFQLTNDHNTVKIMDSLPNLIIFIC